MLKETKRQRHARAAALLFATRLAGQPCMAHLYSRTTALSAHALSVPCQKHRLWLATKSKALGAEENREDAFFGNQSTFVSHFFYVCPIFSCFSLFFAAVCETHGHCWLDADYIGQPLGQATHPPTMYCDYTYYARNIGKKKNGRCFDFFCGLIRPVSVEMI